MLIIRTAWVTVSNPSIGSPPTRWLGESGRDQVRMFLLKIDQLAQQPVVFLIRNLRLCVDVIKRVVVMQLLAKLLDALLIGFRHGGDFTEAGTG
jgi:hypothetical protein